MSESPASPGPMTDGIPDLPEGALVVSRITIVKVFTDEAEGGSAVFTAYSSDLGLLDALGMLAFATATTPGTYMEDDDS